jgi:hypothetical protein
LFFVEILADDHSGKFGGGHPLQEGLVQLLCFVTAEAGVGTGPLICHSTLAELDSGSLGVDGIAGLTEDCREAAVAKPS